mmetsp:Transcript_22380/g.34205  ORF Transcript_22380/g.34205 Transcript_22380/m.34205 type:complete len:433 (+) Transcript_22380:172-1470(+)
MTTARLCRVFLRRRVGGVCNRKEFSTLLSALETFPDIPETTPTPAKASTASVSKLSNGVTVVTEDACASSTIAMTFPKGGSSQETLSETGAALANQYLSFKSGSGLSAALIIRNIEDDGATPFASADRMGAVVGYTCAPDKAARLLPLLVATSSYEKWDVRDAIAAAKEEASNASTDAQALLTEHIYAASYGAQSPLGKPLYSPVADKSAVQSFRDRAYGLKGAVLSATGIADHAEFCAAVEESFSDAEPGTDEPLVVTPYAGGESRVMASSGYAHVALAFEGPSDSALASVVENYLTLVSGDATTGFASPSGLVGLYAAVPSGSAGGLVDSFCSAVTASVDTEVVERAKQMAKAQAIFALDGSSRSIAAAMAASVLESGTFGASSLVSTYDSLTVEDVKAAIEGMAKSKPSLAAVGDITLIPYHGSIVTRF